MQHPPDIIKFSIKAYLHHPHLSGRDFQHLAELFDIVEDDIWWWVQQVETQRRDLQICLSVSFLDVFLQQTQVPGSILLWENMKWCRRRKSSSFIKNL